MLQALLALTDAVCYGGRKSFFVAQLLQGGFHPPCKVPRQLNPTAKPKDHSQDDLNLMELRLHYQLHGVFVYCRPGLVYQKEVSDLFASHSECVFV